MTLETAYPRSEDLWVDPKQRILDANAVAPLASRYSRLWVLLIASLTLHLSFLTALGLLDTVPPRQAVSEPIQVELVTEPAATPKKKPQAAKKSDLSIGAASKSGAAAGKTGDKPAATGAQKPGEKSVTKLEAKPQSETQDKPETKPEDKAEAKPEAKPEAKQEPPPKEPPPKAPAPAQPEPKPPQAEAAKPPAEPPKIEKPQPEKPQPEKPESPKSAAAAANPPAAPKPPPPPPPEAKAAPNPPPTDAKPQAPEPKPQSADAKPAAPLPQPDQQLPPWERPPSAQAAVSEPQQKVPAMGGPINEQAQQAVAVPMPSAGGDLAMSYETIVSGKLALSRRFPPEARARGAHGSAMIDFLIDSDGKVSKIKLLKSSGDSALDVESLAMVMRAAPFPPPPPGAEREFAIMVDFDPKQ